MALGEILISALSAITGAAVKSALAKWEARRGLKATLGKVDDMADSARFDAIEEAVGKLTIQFDAATKASSEQIAELELRLAAATTALAEAHGDLTRSTAATGKYQRVVEFFYGELQTLRRDVGLPALPALETYLAQHGGSDHEPRTASDPDRHHDDPTPRPTSLSAVRGKARRPPVR